MNIAVAGTGYVGLVTGACFAEFGVKVVCVDIDEAKIAALQDGKVPIYEPGLEEMIRRNAKAGRLSFTTDLSASVENSLVVFIAVGTPQGEDGAADLSAVRDVAIAISRNMSEYKIVVTKSTVPMGTGAMIHKLIEENQRAPVHFEVASNPEFLREGSAIEDFMRPNRVVIGAPSEQAAAILKDLYRPLNLVEVPFVVTDVVTAEMIKYASNAFLATKISYINEMALLCEKVGADVHQVARGMGLDKRIGGKFLHPGPGFGGSCFPKDTEALLAIGKSHDVDLKVIRSAVEVNERQTGLMLQKIRQMVGGELRDRVVGMLGLSFKPNTSDVRESPALRVAAELMREGAHVKAYDPAGMKEAAAALEGLELMQDEYAVAQDSDVLVLATEWNQFRQLDLERIRESLRKPVVVDLRNIYEPADMKRLGFEYVGVGR